MEHVAIDERDPATIMILSEEGDCDRQIQGMLSVEAAFRLAEWSAANPNKFRTVNARRKHPEATQQQLANKIGIQKAAIGKHLADAKREIGHLIFIKRKKKK